MSIVETIMIRPEVTLQSGDSIDVALRKLARQTFSTCPVLSPSGEYLGMMTDAVLMRALVLVSSGKPVNTIWELRAFFQRCPTVTKSCKLPDLLKKVLKSPSQRVCVVDSRNQFMGVIRPKNLLKYLVSELGFESGVQIRKRTITKFQRERDLSLGAQSLLKHLKGVYKKKKRG